MPGRPPKSHLQLVNEKKSHRTKAELEQREKGEKALLTGVSLHEWQEVKNDPVAHKEFVRIRKLLKKIQHDDALYEPVINRYCLLLAECKKFEDLAAQIPDELQELKQSYTDHGIEFLAYMEAQEKLQSRLLAIDKRLMDKRKMLLSIEKENVMTILAALRAVPKTPDKGQEKSKMAAFLERRQMK